MSRDLRIGVGRMGQGSRKAVCPALCPVGDELACLFCGMLQIAALDEGMERGFQVDVINACRAGFTRC